MNIEQPIGMSALEPSSPKMGQAFDAMLGFPAPLGDSLRLLTHGSMSFLGFWIAAREKGAVSYIGTGVGILSGLGALMDLISLVDNVKT